MSSARPGSPDRQRARTSGGEPRGLFLSFEGIEGSGKSTHAGRLAEHLAAAGHRVHLSREPGGTGLGEALRGLLLGVDGDPPVPEAELFLMLASRAQHAARVILPRLNRGEIVITDRYADASVAYQGGGRRLPMEWVEFGNRIATYGLEPDLRILVDVSMDEALERVERRRAREGQLDRFDQEDRAFYQRVQDAYRALSAGPGWHVVDSAAPAESVARAVIGAVEPWVARRDEAGALQ